MTSGQLEIVDTYIRQNRSFAIYRLPNEEAVHFVMQHPGPLECVDSIEALNGRKGFVIAPFHITEKQKVVLIRPDIQQLPDKPEPVLSGTKPEEEKRTASVPENRDRYEEIFYELLDALKEKQLAKVVLSRKKVFPCPIRFSAAAVFRRALEKYTRSYVYLYHTPYTGTWLGSTPEMLLAGEKNEWHTVALAGTTPLMNGELPTGWNNKNREEQQLVANYISGQLATLGITPEIKGPYTVRAAHLAHLKSDFRFILLDTKKLGSLLSLLHPTPAIAGIPKQEAIQLILEKEGYNREWYSGFLGNLDPLGKTDIYVNLRCMQIKESGLTLYAGSGLLETSQATEEWQETEDKLQTMISLIDK